MDLKETPVEAAFRAEARSFLHSIMPEVWGAPSPPRNLTEDDDYAMRRRYDLALYRGGWAGLTWKREYGGRGSTPTENLIFAEEAAAAGAPEVFNRSGLGVGGPTIASCGTEQQKRRYLPKILSGEEVWCQGFSEPNAGSDLASLATRAVPAPGGWRIHGQKIWTTLGHFADFCYLLARTGEGERKHEGITALIVSMRQPGVTVRPIRQMSGEHEFCEVFFDGAYTAADQMVGEAGKGWRVAMITLGHERSTHFVARQVRLGRDVQRLVDLVRERRGDVPDGLKDRLASLVARTEALRWTVRSHVARFEAGGEAGVPDSASKVYWSELWQELATLAVEVEASLGEPVDVLGGPDGGWAFTYLGSRAATIYAGTSEIQKNIVAERGLGLPRE